MRSPTVGQVVSACLADSLRAGVKSHTRTKDVMGIHKITIDLSDETIRRLAPLGKADEVLARLASTVAGLTRVPSLARNEETEPILRSRRDKTDAAIAKQRELIEVTREHASRVARAQSETPAAQADSPRHARPSSAVDFDHPERSSDEFWAFVVETTKSALTSERADADALIVDQREANEHMLRATLHADEAAEQADAAQKRAEESARELRDVGVLRDMFIGILGHDLRNPLNSIVMAADLVLKRAKVDDLDASTVSRIVRNGHRITRMITQLLDATRARLGGGFPLEPAACDLREICRNIAEELNAPITLDFKGDMTGTWDPDCLAAALSNLAGNAVQYATPSTMVVVKARRDAEWVVVAVQNHGPPIPAEVLPFIFEPFRRARGQEVSTSGNLGLGLYIAHEIVVAHGGTLHAHCADELTTFVMRLPRHCERAQPNEPEPELDREPEQEPKPEPGL